MSAVIILGQSIDDSGKELSVTFVCWLQAPANGVTPNQNATTQVPPSTAVDPNKGVTWGYTTVELAALQAGTVVERFAQHTFDLSAGPVAVAAIQTALQNRFTALQNQLNAHAAANAHVIGSRWDGVSTWAQGP